MFHLHGPSPWKEGRSDPTEGCWRPVQTLSRLSRRRRSELCAGREAVVTPENRDRCSSRFRCDAAQSSDADGGLAQVHAVVRGRPWMTEQPWTSAVMSYTGLTAE